MNELSPAAEASDMELAPTMRPGRVSNRSVVMPFVVPHKPFSERRAIMSISAISSQQPLIEVQKAAQAPAAQAAPAPQDQPKAPVCDEYVPEDGADRRPSGLYEIVPDGEGRPSIRFDDPEKADRAEQTTTNTDRVDRELEQLRKKAEELQQQAQRAADPRQAQQLERQLQQVQNELRQKDNDAYRRQHAVIS